MDAGTTASTLRIVQNMESNHGVSMHRNGQTRHQRRIQCIYPVYEPHKSGIHDWELPDFSLHCD